ncbi:MAG: BamA/OMP85 family outer membrane protein [Myxococcota bacterium]
MIWLVFICVALAQQVPWYVGKSVSSVSISTPQGGGPEGDLFPLLEVSDTDPLTPAQLRNDVVTLMQVGLFSTVEVDVRQSPMHPNYVDVVYRIFPAPILSEVNIDVPYRRLKQGLISSLELQVGKVFFSEVEINTLSRDIENYCTQNGWGFSEIDINFELDENSQLSLDIFIKDLFPKTIQKVTFVGMPIGVKREVTRILNHYNISEGNRINAKKLELAREDIRMSLFDNGYVQARARIAVIEIEAGVFAITVIVEPDLKLEVRTDGMRISRKELLSILNIYPGDRVTKNDIPKFTERIKDHLKQLGYPDSKVDINIKQGTIVNLLQITIDKRERWYLNDVKVTENPHVDAVALKRLMGPKRTIFQQHLYDVRAIESSLDELEDYYAGLGYVGTTVVLEKQKINRNSTWSRDRKDIDLFVKIEQAEPKVLKDIQVFGVPESISDFPPLPDSSIYAPTRLQVYENEILDFLQSKGFWHAKVELQTLQNEDQSYSVIYNIESGSESLLRSILIQGQGRTEQSLIRERVPVEIGEPIKPEHISAVRQQLYDLDIFQTVRVDMIGNQDNVKDLRISVEEKPNWLLETGGRVSTDQGIQATVSTGPRNINGKASKLSFIGQAGYGWEEEGWRLDVDQLVWRTSIRYTAPTLLNVNHDVFSDVILREILQESYYRFRQSGISFGVESRLSSKMETVFEYRVRYMAVEDIDPGSLVEGDPWIDSFQSEIRTLDGYPIRWWSGVQMTVFWDNRNNTLNPTEGQWFRSQFALGDGLINESPALRGLADYNTLYDFDVLRLLLRLYGGVGWSPVNDTLGFDERFSLGGANSLRGFERNRVGPVNQSLRSQIDFPNTIEPSVDDLAIRREPTQWVPTGGDFMLMVSQELHFPLSRFGYDSSSWIFFFDAGHVGFLSPNIQADSMAMAFEPPFRYALGTGMRYSTAIGPLAVDLAVNPNPISYRDERYLYLHGSLGSF